MITINMRKKNIIKSNIKYIINSIVEIFNQSLIKLIVFLKLCSIQHRVYYKTLQVNISFFTWEPSHVTIQCKSNKSIHATSPFKPNLLINYSIFHFLFFYVKYWKVSILNICVIKVWESHSYSSPTGEKVLYII